MNLILGNSQNDDGGARTRIRGWVRELWELGAEDSVMVTELACTEPGCPPLETVVVIAPEGAPTVQHKLHTPAAEVRRTDLQALIPKERDT